MDIDALLEMGRRGLLHAPAYMTLGPTGRRMWAELRARPGFVGCIDFIHKTNIPALFTLEIPGVYWETMRVRWRPSSLHTMLRDGRIDYEEERFITWDDCAYSLIRLRNTSGDALALRLDVLNDPIPAAAHGYRPIMAFETTAPHLLEETALASGEEIAFIACAALALEAAEARQTARAWASLGPETARARHRAEYGRFFERAPSFQSDSPLLDKTWAYRFFLLRHNLCEPDCGRLRHPFFFEGRSHKMSKEPYTPAGWEFSKFIPLSAPMHILDARWHQDTRYARGVIDTTISTQDEHGLYRCTYTDAQQAAYSNFFGWALYQYALSSGDLRTVRRALPSLNRQIEGWRGAYGNGGDLLMTERVHQLTGKEYQPSYWYFKGYADDPTDPNYITPLKRVDKSVYFVQNLRGAAGCCALLGDAAGAASYENMAARASGDIIAKMWDERTGYYYDLNAVTDEKAYVKNVVAFYPYWAGLGPARGIERLLSPDFHTAYPVPSVSTDEEMFSPAGGWKGRFFKGRNGCVWNGPTWPYTNCVLLDALGLQSRKAAHRYDGALSRLLHQTCLLHYLGGDIERHGLVEHYHPLTGEPLSGEVDYLHSYLIDLFVRYVAGVEPQAGALILEPADMGGLAFSLDRLCIQGREVSVEGDGRRVRLKQEGREAACVRMGEAQRIDWS